MVHGLTRLQAAFVALLCCGLNLPRCLLSLLVLSNAYRVLDATPPAMRLQVPLQLAEFTMFAWSQGCGLNRNEALSPKAWI